MQIVMPDTSQHRVGVVEARPRLRFAAAGEPFDSAEQAWLWTAAALMARRDGARVAAGRGRVQRPCEPDDVLRCLDRLLAARKVTPAHARTLGIWGERQQAPDPRRRDERAAHDLWRAAIALMEPALRSRGMVATRATREKENNP